jgi:hypothetical protein
MSLYGAVECTARHAVTAVTKRDNATISCLFVQVYESNLLVGGEQDIE